MREMSASLISRLTSRPDKDGVKVNILLVDDEPNILEYMKKGLNTNKYNVLTAANGVEALDVLRYQKVDLVVTDTLMPYMAGFELMNRIWGDATIAQMPIILLCVRVNGSERNLSNFMRDIVWD